MNIFSRKNLILLFSVLILLSSALTYNYQVEASVNQLYVDSVSSFTGQMHGSAFARNGTLFAGDSNYNMFRSDNNGATFRQVYSFPKQSNPLSPVTGYVWNIFVDSRNYVFVSIPATNRLYRSTNFGSTFSEVLNTNGAQDDGFYIGITEDTQGSLYVATYSNSIAPQNPPILKSTNGGASWTTLHTFAAVHLHNIKFNPANGYLYVATGEWASGYNNQQSERIFRSKDLGQSWTTVINRPAEIQAIGNTVYLTMLFNGNWVYLGTDQANQPNWIDRFYDDGSNNAYTPQRVYTFPSGSNFPIISAVWLNGIMLFSSTAEFYDGTSRIVATEDGLTYQIIKSTPITQTLHHTNMLTVNPNGIAFGSDGPGRTFSITEKTPQPLPTPTSTPTQIPSPTPNPNFLFAADFETGNFNEYTGISGAGTHSETVENSNSYLGAYAAKFTADAFSEGWAYHSISSSPVTYYRQLIKLNNLPSSGSYLFLGSIQYSNSQNTVDPFIYNDNGQYYWGAVSVINGGFYLDMESSPSNPIAGKHYNIELLRDVTNRKTALWIDGNLKVDASRAHVGNSNQICTGISWTDNTAIIYVDCVRVKSSYIGVENPQPTPTPSPTARPTATPTAMPTPTPTSAPLANALQVSANVTVTAVAFDQQNSTLNIVVVKNGTNHIQATISKTTLPNVTSLRVYINSAQKTFTYIDSGTSWTVTVLTT